MLYVISYRINYSIIYRVTNISQSQTQCACTHLFLGNLSNVASLPPQTQIVFPAGKRLNSNTHSKQRKPYVNPQWRESSNIHGNDTYERSSTLSKKMQKSIEHVIPQNMRETKRIVPTIVSSEQSEHVRRLIMANNRRTLYTQIQVDYSLGRFVSPIEVSASLQSFSSSHLVVNLWAHLKWRSIIQAKLLDFRSYCTV